MVDDAYGATVAKRRLSRRLAELRAASGYTANQVCDKLNWGRGKVGRFEANQWVRPEMSDVRDLLRVYGVGESEQRELEALAVRARTRCWWREYPDVFDNEFPGYEADASAISVYMPLVLPGLVQTRAYIEAHMRAFAQPPGWRARALEARLRRQRILDRDDDTVPALTAVVTEASLMYRWGSPAERRGQVEHLLGLAGRPTVELRLLRFEDGPHPGMNTMINVFGFPGPDPAVVYLEHDVAIQEVTKTDEVDAYTMTFARIRDAALGPADTTAYLKQHAAALE
jgi:transcriptional regulator with XRE-family HTH domain